MTPQLSPPTPPQQVVTVFFRPMFAIHAQPQTGISVQVQAAAVSRPIRN